MTPSTECSNSGLLPQIKFLHGTVLRFWQLDYHLPASAKSMIRTALAAQGWCGSVSGVFWARTPFQFMDGGSVRIPGWATVMGAAAKKEMPPIRRQDCAETVAEFSPHRAGYPAQAPCVSSPVAGRPESTTPEAGARPPESVRSEYGGNVPRRRYHFLYLASTRCETARSEEP
jgi:hypothetical protein